jgi:biotin carboxyl carrier protein
MTQGEWDGCADANKMLAFLHGKASNRQFQLFACASVRRLGADDERTLRWVESLEKGHPEGEPETVEIRVPFVGTFWDKPRPGAPPYVTLDSLVSPYTVVGVIEALKLFNDLPAECSGIVFEVLVNNGDVADYGAPLFRVVPLRVPRVNYMRVAQSVEADRVALVHDVFGSPFRPVACDPAWRTADVLRLAQSIHSERAFEHLPVLADLLEEVGATDGALLGHLRCGSPHWLGCWGLTAVLGQEEAGQPTSS